MAFLIIGNRTIILLIDYFNREDFQKYFFINNCGRFEDR
jgi:hypothetical protein